MMTAMMITQNTEDENMADYYFVFYVITFDVVCFSSIELLLTIAFTTQVA